MMLLSFECDGLVTNMFTAQWVSPMGEFFVFLLLRCVLLTVRRAVIYFIRLFLNLWAFEQSTTMEIIARNMSSYN